MTNDVCFLITTYNRHQSCQRLVNALQGLGSDVVVFNDGSDYTIKGCRQSRYTYHRGKAGYWKTVKSLFNIRGHHKYFIMLPDDFLPAEGMVEEALRLWRDIKAKDSRAICLNLYADRQGVACWTRFKPQDKGEYWLTQWVDMCFLAEDEFFTHVKNIGGLVPRIARQGVGSGVGAYISRGLMKMGLNMYQVKKSLVVEQPEHGVSQMHDPLNRGQNKKKRR